MLLNCGENIKRGGESELMLPLVDKNGARVDTITYYDESERNQDKEEEGKKYV